MTRLKHYILPNNISGFVQRFSQFKKNIYLLIIFFLIISSFFYEGYAQCTVTANAGVDKTVCQGASTTLTASASGGTSPYYYRWTGSTLGLDYACYSGIWSTMPNFTTLTPSATGNINNFDISSKFFTDYFAFKFWGNISIATAGTYTFYTSSDDGSKLYIDGNLIVNNDGVHPIQEVSGTVSLTAGLHFIEVQFFEREWGESLTVSYAGPSITKQPIPDAILSTAGSLSSSYSVSPTSTGTYTVTVTDSKGCTATDAMVITVPGSVANAGSDIHQCNNSSFTMAAVTPSVGSGTWSLISGTGTIASVTNPTTTVTGVPLGTSTSLKWTITSSGCPVNDTVVLYNNPTTSPACTCGTVFSVSGTTTTFANNQVRPLDLSTGQYGAQFGSNLSVSTATLTWDTLYKRMYYSNFAGTTSAMPLYTMNSLGVSSLTGVSLPGVSSGSDNYNRAGYNPVNQKHYFISGRGDNWVSYQPGTNGLNGTVTLLTPTYYPSTAPKLSTSNPGGDIVFDYKGNGYIVTNSGQFYKAFFNADNTVSVVYLGKLNLPMNQVAALAFGSDNKLYVSGTFVSGSTFLPGSNVYYIDLETITTTQVNSTTTSATTDYTSCNYPFYDPVIVPTKSYAKIGGFPSTSITAGDTIEYTIVVANTGNVSAGNVKLYDAVPSNTTYVLNSTKINGTTVSDSLGSTRLAVSGGSFINSTRQTLYNGVIGPGDSAVVKFRVKVSSCMTISNSATVTSGYFNEISQSNIVTFEAVSLPTATITSIETSCTSNDNMIKSGGSVSLTATGGASYSWSGGLGTSSTITVSPTTTTTYTVSVTSSAGCVSAISKTIFVVDSPTANVSATESSCTSDDDKVLSGASVNLSASGSSGTSAYFSIIPTHSSKYIEVSSSSTTAGADIVQRSSTGATNQGWVFISTTTGKPVGTIANGRYYIQNVNSKLFLYPRNGGALNGTAIEQNVVNNLLTQWDVTSVASGQYKIINASNSLGLEIANSSTADGTVLQLAAYTGSSNQIFNLTSNNGYSYTWNNSLGTGSSKTAAPTATTTYTVTLTDVMGCTATANRSITIVSPPTINVSATESSCTSNDDKVISGASVTLTASGGSSYSWNNSLGTGASKSITPSVTTTYSVTAIDANGCTNTGSKTITIITSPSASISATESSCTNNDDKILSSATANLIATASGGGGSFSYTWSNSLGTGAGPKSVAPTSTTTYTVTATDANSCTAIASKTITVVSAPTASIAATESSCTANDDKVLSGASVSMTASGGTSYTWSNSLGSSTTVSATPTSTITYSVTATDVNGCTNTASKTITVVSNPTATISATESSCTVDDDKILSAASVTLTASGGTSYSWNNSLGTGSSKTVTPSATTTYTITATDANGCTNTASKTITIVSAPTASISSTESSCTANDDKIVSGATVSLSASGGTSYSWNNSLGTGGSKSVTPSVTTTYTVTATDVNGCTATANKAITVTSALSLSTSNTNILCNGASTGAINLTVSGGTSPYTYNWGSGITTEDRTGLAAGLYSVSVTDANGCTQNTSATLTQPSAISITTTPTNISCYGASTGAITTSVSGGTSPYTYNWGGGVTTQNRTSLAAGTYNLTVTDANGCTKTTSVTLTQPAAALTLSTSVTNISCGVGTGAINLTAIGGNSPYTYDWGGGITSEDRTGLAVGSYSVTVTDANSCTATLTASVTQTTPPSLTTSVTNIACYGGYGSIDLTVTGSSPYIYSWADGVTTQDRIGLSEGTYSVTVTDANGCTASTSATITTPTALSISSSSTDVGCYGASTGAINVTVSGGTSPYTYAWDDAVTTEDRTSLAAGIYALTVTDANSCTVNLSVTITQPTALNLSTAVTQVTCTGGTDGAIDLSVSGGTSPYSYLWNSGATTQDRTALPAGTYTVTVTDANGCSASTGVTLTPQNSLPSIPTGLRH